MKIGVSYNTFDGEELLEGSIKQIRDQVDYISIVYQTTSNFGNECDSSLLDTLNNLKNIGLVNELYEYKPKLNSGGHFNEITKRNIGLALSIGNGCTHHMSMDSDEYYLMDQFRFLKEEMINGDYDSSFCQLKTYYKEKDIVIDPPEDYYVSLLYKISPYSIFEMNAFSPVLVDPTRRIKAEKYRIFKRDEIEMHHLSYIRNDIRRKLTNSSASVNFKNRIDDLVKYHQEWEYPKKALMAGLPDKYYNVKRVKNLF
jgi:hypothetical protein